MSLPQIAAIAQIAKNVGTFAYNIFSNERHRSDVQSANQENWNRAQNLTHDTWLRDDNAVQRRVADLKAAGLSPILAAGSPAGVSAPIKAEAQAEPTHQITPADIMGVMQMKAQYDHTEADSKRIRQQMKLADRQDRRQSLIDKQKLRELRLNNDAFADRLDEERREWNRRQEGHQDSRAESFQRLLTQRATTEAQLYDLRRRHELEGFDMQSIVGRWVSDAFIFGSGAWQRISREEGLQRTLYALIDRGRSQMERGENLLEAMLRIGRRDNYDKIVVDAVEEYLRSLR